MTTTRQSVLAGRGGRRMVGTGRAAQNTIEKRREHAGPVAPGRAVCSSCWGDFAVLPDGRLYGHRVGGVPCRGGQPIVFLGPLRPPAPVGAPRSVRLSASRLPVAHVVSLDSPRHTACGRAEAGTLPWTRDAEPPPGKRLCGRCEWKLRRS